MHVMGRKVQLVLHAQELRHKGRSVRNVILSCFFVMCEMQGTSTLRIVLCP